MAANKLKKGKIFTNDVKTSNKSRMIKARLKQADEDDRFISIANAVEKIRLKPRLS